MDKNEETPEKIVYKSDKNLKFIFPVSNNLKKKLTKGHTFSETAMSQIIKKQSELNDMINKLKFQENSLNNPSDNSIGANRKSKISGVLTYNRGKKVLRKYNTFNDTLHSNFANLNINISINKSPIFTNAILPVTNKIHEKIEKIIVDPPTSPQQK